MNAALSKLIRRRREASEKVESFRALLGLLDDGAGSVAYVRGFIAEAEAELARLDAPSVMKGGPT